MITVTITHHAGHIAALYSPSFYEHLAGTGWFTCSACDGLHAVMAHSGSPIAAEAAARADFKFARVAPNRDMCEDSMMLGG